MRKKKNFHLNFLIIGVILFSFSFIFLTFAENIFEKGKSNIIPRSPSLWYKVKKLASKSTVVVKEKSDKPPDEYEPGDSIHVPLWGGVEGTVMWKNGNNLTVQLSDGRVAVGIYNELTGEYFWYCLDDYKIFSTDELKRIFQQVKKAGEKEKKKVVETKPKKYNYPKQNKR